MSSQRGSLGDFYSDYSLTFVSSFVARTFEQRRLFIDRPHRFSLKFKHLGFSRQLRWICGSVPLGTNQYENVCPNHSKINTKELRKS